MKKMYDYRHLEEIEVRQDDQQLYTFKEVDFKRLRLQDIKDMLLLLVQQKLTNLTIDESFDLNVALLKMEILLEPTSNKLMVDCKASIAAINQRAHVANLKATITCYECGRLGHIRNECQKLRNQNQVNQIWKENVRKNSKKDVVDGKLARLLKSSKDLESLIESQRPEKIKDGLGYNAVPPPPADLYLTDYSRPSPTIESTSVEGQNKHSTTTENGESTDSILSKPAVKFVEAGDRPAERPTTNKAEFVKAAKRPTTDKVETVKKPAVRYAKMYRRTSKRSTVRGNQRN
nr:hypothetical protein [Tanacetum cinerariifolium]